MSEDDMQFNDLLRSEGVEPKRVMILRHRPTERSLRKVLLWIAAEQHDVFNAYQRTQRPRAEKAMQNADFVASFIGHDSGKALFIGLYENRGSNLLPLSKFWDIPEHKVLRRFGLSDPNRSGSCVRFDLVLMEFYESWKGRLIIRWPGLERSWWRWANRNVMPVEAILEESMLDRQMPDWRNLCLKWDELQVIPSQWRAALSQWRGVYFIFDSSTGLGYVGSAYGKDNLLGRWLHYASTGHGGNKELRKCKPENLQFSILQRVSPDLEADDVIALESSWKNRLHTRECGLNEN